MKLLIAGGGTGGHLFSGLAIAEEWVARGFEVIFVGTPKGLEKELIPKFGYRLRMIKALTLKGLGMAQKLRTLVQLPGSFLESRKILKEEKPDWVLGIGGYASGPTVLMARLMRLPSAIIDQNSIPGMTNRFLGRWTKKVFLTFQESEKYFAKKKVLRVFGNPVLKKMRGISTPLTKKIGSLMVCGGSQGAHRINEIFLTALPGLKKEIPGLFVYWQTGARDFEEIQRNLLDKRDNTNVVVAPFFDDMEKKYAEVELVVARSGAGTLTELALWGLPSILIPYPFAADGHQQENAKVFEKAGAAEVIVERDLDSSILVEQILSLLKDKTKLEMMSSKALQLARPDATQKIVDELLSPLP